MLGMWDSVHADITQIPLNQWPLLMTHDAATGYLKMNPVNNEVYRWTITQTENATGIKKVLCLEVCFSNKTNFQRAIELWCKSL